MRLAVSPEEAAGPFLERAAPGVPGPLSRGPLSAHARGARGVLHSERRGYDTPRCSCREHDLHVGQHRTGNRVDEAACAVPAELESTRPSNGAPVGPIEASKEREELALTLLQETLYLSCPFLFENLYTLFPFLLRLLLYVGLRN